MQRVRITFSKAGALRYIGHLDVQTIWERAARRAGLALAYTKGFHPQPKINFASALPLGYSSRCEVADIRLIEKVELADLGPRLQAAMPVGIGILNVMSVEEDAPPLQSQLIAAEYEVELTDSTDKDTLKRRIDGLLAAATLLRKRRGKAYDLRPLIEELGVCAKSALPSTNGEEISANKIESGAKSSVDCLHIRLTAREGKTGRPDEVLDALGLALEGARIERTRLIFQE